MEKELILDTISDMVKDFLYYDRKEDEYLGLGKIEECIKSGEITIEEIVNQFKTSLEKSL